MTDEELQALCDEWKPRLGVSDWQFKVRFAKFYDIDEGRQAEVSYQLMTRKALIRILDPADYDPACMVTQDVEQSLVHEMLHCSFAPFDAENGTLERKMQEQVIDKLADTMVRLKRGEA